MKRFLLCAAAGGLLAGCATGESGHVHTTPDGTRVYGLNDQPQAAVTGDGTLMPGAYTSHEIQTGQFTGQQRTHDVTGQRPVPPREADPRQFARSSTPSLGTGAGTLGQTGIGPNRSSVTSSNLVSISPDLVRASGEPSPLANPPTMASAPTLAQPLSRNYTANSSNPDTLSGLGGAPRAQTGSATSMSLSNNTTLPVIPRADEALRAAPVGSDSTGRNTAVEDLPSRIRDVLNTGRPESITRLTPDRVQHFDVEAVNGDVTLHGDVRTEIERLMIGSKVAQMQGVRSVNNQLRVTGPAGTPGTPPSQTTHPSADNGVSR